MRYLLDTHVFYWASASAKRISPTAEKIITTRANEVFVSIATLWELCIKSSIGKLQLPGAMDRDPAAGFRQALALAAFHPLSIEVEHVAGARDLPLHHRDPFDRLLIAQALHENLTLVTHDDVFDNYRGLRLLKTGEPLERRRTKADEIPPHHGPRCGSR